MWNEKLIYFIAFVVSIGLVTTCTTNAELIGWWKLDDGSGTIATDSVGNNDGTLIGDTTWVDGKFDGALSFDGDGDYVDCGKDPAFNPTGSFSIAIWANIEDWGTGWGRCMFSKGGDGDADGRMGWSIRRFEDDTLCFTTAGASAVEDEGNTNLNGNTAAPINEWFHIACVYDVNDTAYIYINGEEDASRATTGTIIAGTGNPSVYIGTRTNTDGTAPDDWAAAWFNGMLDDARYYDHALTEAEVFGVMSGGPPTLAAGPLPANNDTDVIRDELVLSWRPGEYAVTHDVYFGTSPTDVNEASRDNPLGVLVGPGLEDTSYPLGRLDLGETYYWRVDEINDLDPNSPWKGKVWNFTVEPEYYVLPGDQVTVSASSSKSEDQTAAKTIDESGLVEGQHSTTHTDMWLSGTDNPDGIWIAYDFGKVYALGDLWIWNYNHRVGALQGWTTKDITIEYTLDGTEWLPFGTGIEVPNPTGQSPIEPSLTVALDGLVARSIRIVVDSTWKDKPQAGLSEVRFHYKPTFARYPNPEPGVGNLDPNGIVLSWRAGREVDTHKVFIDSDVNAVIDETVQPHTVTDKQFDISPLDLSLGTTYYWKVNEVNSLEDPSVWQGWIWNISTLAYRFVDDFEDYNNGSATLQRPFQTWIDGFGYANPAPGKPGNNTGAGVGHDIWDPQSPYYDGFLMEQTYAHSPDGGSQSIPLYYDNSGANGKLPYSEMTRTFDPPVDWNANGVSALVLFFQGQAGNTGSLYAKINGTKIVYTDDPGAIAFPAWTQWNIDLTGLDVSSVSTLTIGMDDAGASGLILVDDIRIYGTAPALPGPPTDPGNSGRIVWYPMNNNMQDASGNGNNGTWWGAGNPIYVDGPAGLGSGVSFNAISDYIAMPIGDEISTMTDFTFAGWVNFAADQTGDWQRIFDIGIDPNVYMFLTPRVGGDGALRFAQLNEDITGEDRVETHGPLPAGWHHVAVTISSTDRTIRLYQNGALMDTDEARILPMDLGETTQNWLGRSQFTADAFFNGSMDEIMIFNRALSDGEIRYLAGDR